MTKAPSTSADLKINKIPQKINNSEKQPEVQDNFASMFGAPKQQSNLNAKKLDINFDNDDFFNSFDPSAAKPAPKKEPV